MKRICLVISCIALTLLSCNSRVQQSNEKDLIKAYYASLNNFQLQVVSDYFYDSVRMKENDYRYIASKDSFYLKLQWDSVFRPKYKVIAIEEASDDIMVEVSKSDPRILFLNEEPTIYRDRFSFKNGKIHSIETVEFILFNWDLWDENRSKIVNYIKDNQPELDGFLYDQTKQGGINYLKAINLYKAAHQD
ncbi:hypothetical protein BFP97_06835 [Roseivirga sp. 4D4]|uniref:hypothetical protein n=1 Tax=Roseivirga sp. 4D4 TaxID=1889784 RepID=UPI0008539169|nr:hypothetical protein [Roseivirga sp. 4D4]OEK01242.1 hypothetical protein BFP97_06835 [Roseivirga sp. 4D4]